jgi:hypothetical protein
MGFRYGTKVLYPDHSRIGTFTRLWDSQRQAKYQKHTGAVEMNLASRTALPEKAGALPKKVGKLLVSAHLQGIQVVDLVRPCSEGTREVVPVEVDRSKFERVRARALAEVNLHHDQALLCGI